MKGEKTKETHQSAAAVLPAIRADLTHLYRERESERESARESERERERERKRERH